jgi:hypothetical protein
MGCQPKYDVEVTGRLLHPNLTPVYGQGLILKGDNAFGKDNAKYLTDATHGAYSTDANGYFTLFAKAPRNNRCYLNAEQVDGSFLRITEVFHISKNNVTDLGDIIVTW